MVLTTYMANLGKQRSKFQWTSISVVTSILLFADSKKKVSAKRLPNPRSVGLRFDFPIVKKKLAMSKFQRTKSTSTSVH